LNLKSLPGAALMLSLVLYPYVYLMARAAFLDQSANLMEAAYTLGQSRWSVFRRVVIPMARPAIVAGTLLALMETLADFGTVQYFGVQTFTTGIVRTYYGFGDTVGAAQLSSVLLGFVFVLIVVERLSRHRVQYYSDRLRQLNQASVQLRGRKAFWMQCLCAIPVCFGFVLPTTLLLYWSVFFAELESLWGVMANSFLLAGGSAILIVTLALMVAYANRLHPSRWLTYLTLLVGLGYALPGVVIAMGVLIPFSVMDQWISAQLAPFGVPPSLYFSGTVFALVFAYVVRFLAVANGTIFSGLSRIRPSLDHSGRLLGLTQTGVLRSIHVPLMRGSVLTAALVCFVDILKELPATLMLRPFNFDTLAVKTYALASEERLIDAAAPALLIVVVGLLPVIWLNRSVSKE
jgi:iron(III) transport system permease protein